MRTAEEILARIEEIKDRDWIGLESRDLIECLPFALAQPFLKPEVTEVDWRPESAMVEHVKARMLDYMPFAWEKANNCRGLSAGRSMSHYMAWVWLAGDDLGDLTNYRYYDKDNLVRICEHYGWNHAQWDDGEREYD